MSVVSGNDDITLLVDGDQITSTLYATKPLVQYVKKGTNSIMPDWTIEENQPVIYNVSRSQNTGLRKELQPESEEFFYNGQKLTFNAEGICTTPAYVAGIFKKTTYNDGDNDLLALRIIGNLASPINVDNDLIKFSFGVEIGGVSLAQTPQIPIRIEETVGDPYDGYIDATDAGVIDDNTDSTTLTGVLMKGGGIVSDNVVYQWYKAILGGWQAVSALPGQPNKAKFYASDIDSELLVKLDFIVDNEVVFSSVRPLYDETDPLVMNLNRSRSPQLKVGTYIDYAPDIRKRSTGEIVPGYEKFSFTAYSRENKLITIPASQVTDKTCRITADDVTGIGKGGISLYVSTVN